MQPRLTTTSAMVFAGALLFSVTGRILCQQPERTTLPIPPPPFRGTITREYATSTLEPTAPLTAPAGAPNVLLILIDDAGYGQTATFGGIIPTPTLDSLAANGARYTRFNVTALCSPTRAALMTGRNSHDVGMGTITNWSNGFPGYTSSIPKSAAFVSEILRENGYATAAIGKWHLIPDPETTLAGPFDHWPTHEGFDYYYGFIGAETDQWYPELTEGIKPVEMKPPPGRVADYTLNEDLADHACAWILQQKSIAPDRPIFMYYASGATHAPIEAPQAWIDKFKGKFDMGWDKYREQTLARQIKLGVVPPGTHLTSRPAALPAWDSLTPDQKKVAERLMEVFAGYMAQADFEIGHVIDTLRRTGQLKNTLIFYIAGDNGASLEGGVSGTDNIMEQINGIQATAPEMLQRLNLIGGPHSNPIYPAAWAWAGNTPFQWGKRIGSHLGGTRDPLVVAWPGHIQDPGSTRSQYTDVTDVAPTILAAAHIPEPVSVDGVLQQRVDGVSFLDTFENASTPEFRTTQYFETLGNLAIYHDGWIAARRSGVLPWSYFLSTNPNPKPLPWELYDIDKDYSEANNLAARHPARLDQLEQLFTTEAERNKVFPIDTHLAGHPSPPPPGGRAFYTFYPGATHLYNSLAPRTRNCTHTFIASVDIPPGGANGVLVAEGGNDAGYSLYIKDGRPAYTYNYFRHTVTTIEAKDKLPVGKSVIKLHFAYDGNGLGKGATVTLMVNGKVAARTHLSKTVPVAFSFEETFDVGEDSASPVGPYNSPFAFTGTLEKLEVHSSPPPVLSAADAAKQRQALRHAAAVAE